MTRGIMAMGQFSKMLNYPFNPNPANCNCANKPEDYERTDRVKPGGRLYTIHTV